MNEPCLCKEPNRFCRRAGVPMVGRLWELCQTSEDYRNAWDGALPANRPRCVHLGRITGSVECDSCAGRVHLKVFQCGLHGQCTIARDIPGFTNCSQCSDYQAEEVDNGTTPADSR
jgi:hypothetical protein